MTTFQRLWSLWTCMWAGVAVGMLTAAVGHLVYGDAWLTFAFGFAGSSAATSLARTWMEYLAMRSRAITKQWDLLEDMEKGLR